MKVLMVTHYYSSHPGGIELVANQMFRRLAEPDREITWAAADVSAPPGPLAHTKTMPLRAWNHVEQVIGLPFPVPSPISLSKLWSAVRASDAVVIHDCLYLSNIAAFLFAKIARVPVLIVQHIGSIPFSSFPMAVLMKLANLLVTKPMLRRADQVAFISQITQRHFRGLRFAASPVLIFNGVDTQIFFPPPDHAAKSALRRHFGLPPEKPVVLFVGRFVEKKGLHILQRMARQDQGVTWTFAGSGPLDPRSWGLPNVHICSDLSGPGLADLYRAADAFVLPSMGEGFPLVIQEALACGLPVVCGLETATADDALASFVRGVSFTPDDEDRTARDFLSVTHDVLQGAATPHSKIERFEFVQKRYSWAHIAESYAEVISRLTSGSLRSEVLSSTERLKREPSR